MTKRLEGGGSKHPLPALRRINDLGQGLAERDNAGPGGGGRKSISFAFERKRPPREKIREGGKKSPTNLSQKRGGGKKCSVPSRR